MGGHDGDDFGFENQNHVGRSSKGGPHEIHQLLVLTGGLALVGSGETHSSLLGGLYAQVQTRGGGRCDSFSSNGPVSNNESVPSANR